MDEKLEAAKERAWRSVAAIDAAYARGELDDNQWHCAMATFIVPAYLHADSVRGGSGHYRIRGRLGVVARHSRRGV